ncbi:MAG: class I SAM-dependent methyltransferase [Thaumarchaeota archaeon]|nr:class I SAM-dependent methyltransferase [Nitrososphaerota archaeon]
MLRIFELDEYIKKNQIEIPKNDEFEKLVNNLAYFQNAEGNNEITNLNYERGLLLYGLIKKYHPTNVLEFGTAKGFSTLCMAWAMSEVNDKGNIFTIDYIGYDQKILHHYKKSDQIHKKIATRENLWQDVAPSSWLKNVKVLTGYGANVVSKNKFPKIQFFYIDAAHFYEGVKNDFFLSLTLSDSKSYILFDDYIERPFYGVKKLIDNEIACKFNVDLIKIDKSNYFMNNGITKSQYGMCFLEVNKNEMIETFGSENVRSYLKKFQRYEKRLRYRNNLNRKIPFLKKIRFSKLLKSRS